VTSTNSKTKRLSLLGILVLSTCDTYATAFGVAANIYSEQNPIMEYALDKGLIVFTLSKTLIVLCSCLVLYKFWEHRWTPIAVTLSIAVYTSILLMHSYLMSSVYF